MDFEFSPEQQAFAAEVEAFLDANDDPDVFDVTRENMAQIVDTPKRRAFMAKLGEQGLARPDLAQGVRRLRGRGRLRVPAQRAARRARRPADRQGRRHHRQDADRARQRLPEAEVPARRSCATRSSSRSATASPTPAPTPRRCGSRPSAPSATADGLAPQRPEDLDHLGALRRVVLARHPHRPRRQAPRHHADARAARPARHHDQRDRDHGRVPMGDERTNEVFIDDVFVPDEYVVGEVNRGFQYISQALDLERFTMFTFSPIKQRLDLLVRLRPHRGTRRRAAAGRPGRSAARSRGSPPRPRSPGARAAGRGRSR